jgi:hypothetical protein
MRSYERIFAGQVASIINKYVNRAARNVRINGKQTDLSLSLDGMADDMRVALRVNYERVAKAFGDRIFDAFKSHPLMLEHKDAEDIFAVQTEQWIAQSSSTKVVGIVDTTLNQIRSAFESGFAENLTGTEVAKRITQKAGGVIARSRALVIARTETHAASQIGSLEAAKSTNIPMLKVWVSAEDERTRETHTEADAKYHANPIPIEDDFQVGGDSMPAPGLGSMPEENIQCRCVVTYITK